MKTNITCVLYRAKQSNFATTLVSNAVTFEDCGNGAVCYWILLFNRLQLFQEYR